MDKVFFTPWIGKFYSKKNRFGMKILVLGESHYCGGCNQCGLKYAAHCDDLTTTKCVEDFLYNTDSTPGWKNTYLKFVRSLVGFETNKQDNIDIFNSIAFYNFLQVALTESRKQGMAEDYEEAKAAFLQVINELKPDLIIVWGVGRMYDELPSQGWILGKPVIIDDFSVKNGYYQRNDGGKSRIFNVYHPSSGYNWNWWYKVIRYFINEKDISKQSQKQRESP